MSKLSAHSHPTTRRLKRVHVVQAVLITLIRFYRFAISVLLGHCCRFEPSCSTYAMDAIRIHGCFRGCYFALRRILRCHPWHPGGMDPVSSLEDREMKNT